MPRRLTIPVEFQSDMLTYEQCAIDAQVHISTVKGWASKSRRRALRLPVVDLGHRTKRVRVSDWRAFQSARVK